MSKIFWQICQNMPQTLQTFVFGIAIIEGRHYIWPNTNSAVIVQIEKQKKCTDVKFNSDCPYYNEYFVFDFLSTIEDVLDKTVTITVVKPGSVIRKQKILGCVSFDIATVWNQKDHQFYHKWAILIAPSKETADGTRGYLKLDVNVLAKGEVPKIPPFVNTDEIEVNLFVPGGVPIERQRVNFIIDIFRGVDLVKRNPTQEGVRKIEVPSASHIGVSFSGVTMKTTYKKNIATPAWNERLILPELFPPLCQRFKIELYHDSHRRATRYINLRTISSDNENGFLPTFGPSFIHFYSPNNLEGYLGKLLLSVHTSLLGGLVEYETQSIVPPSVPIIREEYFLKFEDIIVFATIFEVTSIVKKFSDKSISFRLSCGPLLTDDDGDKDIPNITPPIKPQTVNQHYSFLPIEQNKPCVYVRLSLPDIRKRIYNYNLLTKISMKLKSRLDHIENIYHNQGYKSASAETKFLLLETLDFVSWSTEKYIDIASNYNMETYSVLDQQRLHMCLTEIESIMSLSKNMPHNQSRKKLFQKLEKFHTRIQTLIDIIEDWPRIYFWMIYGGKRVAYYIIQPRDIIHSPIEEEKGIHCGLLRTIYLQTETTNQNIADIVSGACKVDGIFWMGLQRHLNDFNPSGYSFTQETFPRHLIGQESHTIQALAYIFQGRFSPGSDKSGLCDPFIHVLIGSEFRQTKIMRKTLTPVWDETLVFSKMIFYGSSDFILANPPTVSFEVFDKDEFFQVESVGKCIVNPFMKLLGASSQNPVKLAWHKIYHNFDVNAEVLAAVEFVELSQQDTQREGGVIATIPPEIKPHLTSHRIEVVFWGVRDLKRVQMFQINKPKILVECGNENLTSDILVNAKKSLNFTNNIKMFEATFPEEQEFAPPLCLKMIDCRNFGINVLTGTHVSPLQNFYYKPLTALQREAKIMDAQKDSFDFTSSLESIITKLEEPIEPNIKIKEESKPKRIWCCGKKKKKKEIIQVISAQPPPIVDDEEVEDSVDFDWWTKFHASLEETPATGKIPLSHKHQLTIYQEELEQQPEFNYFTDTLVSFRMYRGKRTGDESVDEDNTTGVFKGILKVYRWPLSEGYVTASGLPLEQGIFQDFPLNTPVRYVLRVYCIRGINLMPKDLSGKSDPYIRLRLNQQIINDKENRIMAQLNPVFGKCFEMNGIFPQDHILTVSVMDYDAATADDLIGETKIDLENRFYTRHRAHCGLAAEYHTSGYCQWRDEQKPTTVLENLCKRFSIPDLTYESTFVRFACREFSPKDFKKSQNEDLDRQVLALEALKHWSTIPIIGSALVPEHVETRSLFNPQKPGIEQLWIDILPCLDLPIPKQVNIQPRKPVGYELRVIVWNGENILLEEYDFLTGGKKSDIFVKGWVTTPESAQYTDVHYRSLTGEANFNWRFIFTFDYIASENRTVLKKKTLFGSEEETKSPCKLTLQTWDNDTFSYSDFLGVVTLELSKLPRGASTAKACSLSQSQSKGKFVNLFKIRRTKGWWPLKSVDAVKKVDIFAGSLELEFELLTKEDALKAPAGFGRDDPQGLPKPKRPDTAFSFFKNPFKTFKYAVKLYRKKCLKSIIIIFLIVAVVVALYHMPQYGIKHVMKL